MLVVSGCAALPESPAGPRSSELALPPAIQLLLEQEHGDARSWAERSPWGDGVILELHPSYSAASGRTCRRVTIEPAGAGRSALVCREHDGQWVSVRVLHDGGRARLLDAPGWLHAGGAE
jgi:hypothetical protein